MREVAAATRTCRIPTNACLNAPARNPRRLVPQEVAPPELFRAYGLPSSA